MNCWQQGLLVKNHLDCGCLLYDPARQKVKSGASGSGCCAAVGGHQPPGCRGAGVGKDGLHFAFLHHFAAVQNGHPAADLLHHAHLVGDDHYRSAQLFVDILDQGQDRVGGGGVQGAGSLVAQQHLGVGSQRSCLKNICFPMELAGVKKADAEKRARELLEVVGLPDKADAYPAQLSGGQKQRIAIARALATNPKVLLCDEATSALDPTTTHSILTLIKDINKKLGITVVVITHQMSVVEEICSRVAILDGGEVVEEGEVEAIFANPRTPAARRLVAPNGGAAAQELASFAPDDHVVRVTFNGSSTTKPLVAGLAVDTGILVSVLSADTRDLNGRCFGSMLLKLPREIGPAQRAVEYIRGQDGVSVEEVNGL